MTDELEAYLANASERYRATHAQLHPIVKRHFRNAKAGFHWGMPGWVARRPPGAKMPERKGTMDPTLVFIGFVERKNGLTLHVWHPGAHGTLTAARKKELAAVGLKAMVGCFVFSRKGDYPLDAVDEILRRTAAIDRTRSGPP